MEEYDIVIKNATLVTMDEKNRVIKDGAIAINKDRISFVGKTSEFKQRGEIEIDGTRKIVIPGLINSHTHMFQTLMRGVADDLPLLKWLKEVIMPLSLNLKREHAYAGALLGCIENLKTGSTTIIDNHYIHFDPKNTEYVIKAIKETGIRGMVARGYYIRLARPEFNEDLDKALKDVENLMRKWNGKENGRIMICPAPMTVWSQTEESLKKTVELAEKYDVPIHIHTAETKAEVELVKKHEGKTSVEWLYSIGVLNERFHLVHAIWLTDKEVKMMAKSGAHVVHNPVSNMIIGSGVAKVPLMIREDVNIGLGSDGPASNNNEDMVEVLKFASLLHKVHHVNPAIITANQVFKMATLNGAKLLRMEDKLGSLEIGKKADITVIDINKSHIAPVHNPISAIVYCAYGTDVDTVIVDGKIVVQNGELITINEQEVLEKAWKAAYDLIEKTGMKN